MTDQKEIVWGPAIAVDGKRPGWLKDDDKIRWYSSNMGDAWWDNLSHRGYVPVGRLAFDREIHSIRLPADHPHYRQTEVAPIDWSGELEAVHEDGRVMAVTLAPDEHGCSGNVPRVTNESPGVDTNSNWYEDGTDYCHNGKWRIRNVAQPTPQADTKPDVTARMEALVRRMANPGSVDVEQAGYVSCIDEARAIVALLPEPVDPDEEIAKTIEADHAGGNNREFRMCLAAIKKGRELALAEQSGC